MSATTFYISGANGIFVQVSFLGRIRKLLFLYLDLEDAPWRDDEGSYEITLHSVHGFATLQRWVVTESMTRTSLDYRALL